MEEHALGRLTTSELARHIESLLEALKHPLTDPAREETLLKLSAAYREQNQRASVGAMPPAPDNVHEITRP